MGGPWRNPQAKSSSRCSPVHVLLSIPWTSQCVCLLNGRHTYNHYLEPIYFGGKWEVGAERSRGSWTYEMERYGGGRVIKMVTNNERIPKLGDDDSSV